MRVREDGPLVLRYFLLFEDKFYFFLCKLELKFVEEVGIFVSFVDVLQSKQVTQQCYVHNIELHVSFFIKCKV